MEYKKRKEIGGHWSMNHLSPWSLASVETMHKQPCYKDAPAYVNGVSEALFKVGMCLPAGPYVSDDDVRYIVETIKENILWDLILEKAYIGYLVCWKGYGRFVHTSFGPNGGSKGYLILFIFSGAEKTNQKRHPPLQASPIWEDVIESHGRPMTLKILVSLAKPVP